jgi:hypothetical protein
MNDRQMSEFLWALLTRAPVFVVTIGGIVWCIVQWRKASNAALYAMLACIALLLASCVFPTMFSWLTPMMARNAPPGDEITHIIWTNRAILMSWNLCTAVCLAALIFAVFAGRAAAVRRAEEGRTRRRDDIEDEDAPPGFGDKGIDDRIKPA